MLFTLFKNKITAEYAKFSLKSHVLAVSADLMWEKI